MVSSPKVEISSNILDLGNLYRTHYILSQNMSRATVQNANLAFVLLLVLHITIPLVGDKILLLPFPWPSHYTQLEKIGLELMNRKHDVIMIMPSTETYHTKSALINIEYKIPGLLSNTFVSIAEGRLENGAGFGINWLVEYVNLLEKFGRALLEDPVIKMEAKNADIVISDTAFIVAPIFADFHKLPLVFLSPFGHLPGCMSDTYGSIENPSLVPTFVATALFERIGLPQKMTFLQRNFNIFSNIISKILRDTITVPILRQLTKKHSRKTLLQLWEQVALVLIPMDYSIEYPRPDLPFVKMIGPLTTRDLTNSLPTPFDEIFNDSSEKVIIFSFGITNRISTQDTLRILEGLLTMNYTIIWKYDRRKLTGMMANYPAIFNRTNTPADDVVCDIAERGCGEQHSHPLTDTKYAVKNCRRKSRPLKIGQNVYVFDWLPQQRLVQEQKTHMLVTHCGLNSLYEALYHNTLVLCVPLFGEQFDNAGRVVSRKLGKALTIQELNRHSLEKTIYELTAFQIYARNVQRVSHRLRRSHQSPAEKAANWIEFVLAEKGDLSYLKPINLPYYQYYLMDVLLFWVTLLYTVYFALNKFLTLDYEAAFCRYIKYG